jgi:predicted Zn-dependent protease
MTIQNAKKMLVDGDVAGARSHLVELAKAEPSEPRVWRLLAGIAIREENWELGLKAFKALKALQSESAFVCSGLVQCLYQSSEYSEALAEIERFTKIARRKHEVDLCVLAEFSALKERIVRLAPELSASAPPSLKE